MILRQARPDDVAPLLALINGYARRGLLLPRTEAALRACLDDFTVAERSGRAVGCGALRLVDHLMEQASARGLREVIALTLRRSFFETLGFEVTERERFVDKLRADCAACPRNLCCDEIAMVRPVRPAAAARPRAGTMEGVACS
jgi:amino-acid N-acetyltransferase